MTTVFVSPLGSDSWSGSRPSPNCAKTDGPLATIAAALRLAGKRSPQTGFRIVLRGGRHELKKPLLLTPKLGGEQEWQLDNGKYTVDLREWPLTFMAFENEVPVISGGRNVTGWIAANLNGREVWTAKVPRAGGRAIPCRQLFVNGGRRQLSRWPKQGFLRVADVPGWSPPQNGDKPVWTHGQDFFSFAEGEWPDLEAEHGISVVFLQRWIESRTRIASIDRERRLVQLDRPATYSILHDGEDPQQIRGARYFLENVLTQLSEPGEWAYDARAGKIYYLPLPGETPESIEAIMPVLPCLIRLRGGTGESAPERTCDVTVPDAADSAAPPGPPVLCVRFSGVSFAHTEWRYPKGVAGSPQSACNAPGAVVLDHAADCSFENCRFEHVGAYALELLRGSREVRVENCQFTDLGAGGIKIWHGCRRNLVADCDIGHGGRIFPSGVGILIGRSGGNRILRNEIHDLYYTGVSVGWTWGYQESEAYGNIIESNHIFNIGRDWLSDMGGIYLLGVSPGTRVRFNIIHDVRSAVYGGVGIYPDEGCSDVLIEGNVVFACRSFLLSQHYGRRNIIRGNYFAGGEENQLALHRAEPGRLALIFEENLLIHSSGEALQGGYMNSQFYPGQVDFRDNLYLVNGNAPRFMGMNFAAWREAGMDRESSVVRSVNKAWQNRENAILEGVRSTPGFAPARRRLSRFVAMLNSSTTHKS